MSLIGPGKGLIAAFSRSLQYLSLGIDQPLPYGVEQLLKMIMIIIMMIMRADPVVDTWGLQTWL